MSEELKLDKVRFLIIAFIVTFVSGFLLIIGGLAGMKLGGIGESGGRFLGVIGGMIAGILGLRTGWEIGKRILPRNQSNLQEKRLATMMAQLWPWGFSFGILSIVVCHNTVSGILGIDMRKMFDSGAAFVKSCSSLAFVGCTAAALLVWIILLALDKRICNESMQ